MAGVIANSIGLTSKNTGENNEYRNGVGVGR